MNCRLCLKEVKRALKIFDERRRIAEILQRHFWFTPHPDDNMSNRICRGCWSKVNDFHKFYTSVEQAHETLTIYSHKALEEGELGQSFIKEEAEAACPEAKSEEDPVGELCALEVETLRGANVVEAEQKIEQDRTSEDDEKSVKMETDSMSVCSNTELAELTELTTPKETRKHDTRKRKVDEVPKTAPKRKRSMRKKLTPNDDVIIKKHITMGCDFCAFLGEDFSELTTHFKLHHEQLEPYVKCCGYKLNKRFKIAQHAYKHEDPDFFRCNICEKSFASDSTLRHHMAAVHPPEELCIYACDQCDKKFSRKSFLEQHKPIHIPPEERKFVCEKCPRSKPFASKHLLGIHNSMCHNKVVNVCHVCAREIRDKKSFEKHVRLHFEDSGPRLQCPYPGCDTWLKDAENLRHHVRRHTSNDTESLNCNKCGKTCKNRRALTSHRAYAHRDEVYACEMCNKTFKKALTLREHMAQHTGESLYKCPFCTRTFNSNANMHSHKKKMHPVEWDLWRKTKRGSAQKIITSQSLFESIANDNE